MLDDTRRERVARGGICDLSLQENCRDKRGPFGDVEGGLACLPLRVHTRRHVGRCPRKMDWVAETYCIAAVLPEDLRRNACGCVSIWVHMCRRGVSLLGGWGYLLYVITESTSQLTGKVVSKVHAILESVCCPVLYVSFSQNNNEETRVCICLVRNMHIGASGGVWLSRCHLRRPNFNFFTATLFPTGGGSVGTDLTPG